ncbi:MAG: glycosyltransferase family 4 protein [Pseudomonadota bacterium]
MMATHAPQALDAVEFNNMVTPYTRRLFDRLNADGLGLAVVSCTRSERNRRWRLAGESGFRHEVLPGVQVEVGPRRFAHLNRGIFRTLSRLRPRLLVLNGFYPSMLLGLLWARLTRTPVALRVDGGANDMPMSAYHRLFRPMLLRRCRAVLTCGAKGAAFFRDAGVEERRIFHMPLVPAWDGPGAVPDRASRGYDLLWAAEISDAVKNAGFFAEVAVRLNGIRPGLRVRVVGTGADQQAMIATLAEAGVAFRHDETVPWDEMQAVFCDARLLLLPSRREPWGLVCNEAMQCGTPCLVSPFVGAADDLVIDRVTGRVLPLEVERWAEAAAQLLDDPVTWSRLSEAGRTAMAGRGLGAAAAAYRAMVAFVLRAETDGLA